MFSGAELMTKSLEAEGINTIFGYPGAAICPFYDALISSSIKHILVRNEQNAGHSASGYARITGRPAVCVATSGPGATNLITAIACAYMDSIPIIAITGQVESNLLGSDVFQEADITGACEPFTKHSYIIKDVNDITRVFKEAFHIAITGRPGPVLIDIPVDIQMQSVETFDYSHSVNIIGYKPNVKGHSQQIKNAVSAIENSKRPLICVGGGAFSSQAEKQIRNFVDKTGIPIVSTMMGIGILPHDDPRNLGMLGSHGVKSANTAIAKADLIILCGARVGDRAIAKPHQIASHAKIIHIDIDPAEIGKNVKVTIPIVGDAKSVMKSINENINYTVLAEWTNSLIFATETINMGLFENFVNPKFFINLLCKKLPENSVIVADVGQNQIWSANGFSVKNGRFLTSGGMGTMGYSIPAAIGAKLANKANTVVAICGDGSFQMMFNELATAAQHGVCIKIIVLRNNRLGMVNELQNIRFNGRHNSVNLSNVPDFIAIASAYSITAKRITNDTQIESAIDEMLSSSSPYLIECLVSPEQMSL